MTKKKFSISVQNSEPKELKELIAITVKLWRKYHLTYDQAGYVGKSIDCKAYRRLHQKRGRPKKPGGIITSSDKFLQRKGGKTKADCSLRILQNYQKTLHKPKSPLVFSALQRVR